MLFRSVFREGVDPVELHWTISALCLFNVSNRYTFSVIFKRDLGSAAVLAARRQTAIDTILNFVCA